MAEIHFKAFLSCRLAEEDKKIVEFFKKIIKSFNIEPQIYDYQEIGKITDKVKENIINSDCIIAIATKAKKITGSDYWTCSDWIQHELALANAYNKPIAIFVEEGVKIEGLIEMEERRERFNRDDLISNIDKITSFLFNLRNHMETKYQSGMVQTPVLLRHYIHAKEEMLSKDETVLRCEILMESLIDELESTDHSMELEDTTPGLSAKAKKFDFICKEKPSNMHIEPEIIQNNDAKFLWKLTFNPPLKKGERVKYAFKILRSNYRPYTYEEMMERIQQGTYEYKTPKCEACEWYISYPTAELIFNFEFPEGYEIKKYYPEVRKGQAIRLKAEDEVKKILEGNMFTAEKIFDKWTFSLKVQKPNQDHIYHIYYEPPKSSEL